MVQHVRMRNRLITDEVAELNSVTENVNSVPTKVTKCSNCEDIKSVTVEHGKPKCTVKNELMQEVIGSIEFLDQNNLKMHPVVKLYRLGQEHKSLKPKQVLLSKSDSDKSVLEKEEKAPSKRKNKYEDDDVDYIPPKKKKCKRSHKRHKKKMKQSKKDKV